MAARDFFYYLEDSNGNRIIKSINLDLDSIMQINSDGEIETSNSINSRLQIRRGTLAELELVVLSEGELGYTTDTKEVYVGDGATYGGNKIIDASDFGKSLIASSDAEEARETLGISLFPTSCAGTIQTIFVSLSGNDSTGTKGDPYRPYLTAQAAFNQAATLLINDSNLKLRIHFEAGEYSNISITHAQSNILNKIFWSGAGSQITSIGSITGENGIYGQLDGVGASIYLYSDKSLKFGNISAGNGYGEEGGSIDGGNGGSIYLDGIFCSGSLTSGSGGSTAYGAVGGNAGNITLNNCRINGNITTQKGGASEYGSSVTPGDGPTCKIDNCKIYGNISKLGSGDDNGGGIFGSTCGALTIYRSVVDGTITISSNSADGYPIVMLSFSDINGITVSNSNIEVQSIFTIIKTSSFAGDNNPLSQLNTYAEPSASIGGLWINSNYTGSDI